MNNKTEMYFSIFVLPIALAFNTSCGSSFEPSPSTYNTGGAANSQTDRTGDVEAMKEYNYAVSLKNEGKLDEALQSVDKSIEKNPDFSQAHFTKGSILRKMDRLEESATSFKKARELNDEYASAWAMEGAVLLRLGRDKEAEESLSKALKQDSKNIDNYTNLGMALRRQGKFDDALKVYEKGMEVSFDPELLNNYSVALRSAKRLDESITFLMGALEQKPDSGILHLNLGIALRTAERYDEAVEHYEKAFELGVKSQNAFFDLGYCYEQLKKKEKAIEWYEKFMTEARPGDTDAKWLKRAGDSLKRLKGK